MRNGKILASLQATANSPTVAITSPANGATLDAAAPFEIAWTATDADGDTLTFNVLYSPDGGVSWFPLGLETREASMAVDLSQIAGGADVLFQVRASDGLNTTEATAGPVNVMQQPAVSVRHAGGLGRLRGRADETGTGADQQHGVGTFAH